MSKLAFLGLGAMGSRMAANLVEAGHDVTVWNRTPERAAPLVELGAKLATTPANAAKDADVVLSMVRDDTASNQVWNDPDTGAFQAMSRGALGIECSTLSPHHVRSLHEIAATKGLSFLDAPLAGSRPQAEAAQLIFLVGGDAAALEKADPILGTLGAAVHHAGGPGAGAIVKLMVNSLFATQLATLAELLGFAEKAEISPARALEIIGATPVASPIVKASGAAMLAGAFAPAFPIELVQKDLAITEQATSDQGAASPMVAATSAVFGKAAQEGFDTQNITGVAQLYLTQD